MRKRLTPPGENCRDNCARPERPARSSTKTLGWIADWKRTLVVGIRAHVGSLGVFGRPPPSSLRQKVESGRVALLILPPCPISHQGGDDAVMQILTAVVRAHTSGTALACP